MKDPLPNQIRIPRAFIFEAKELIKALGMEDETSFLFHRLSTRGNVTITFKTAEDADAFLLTHKAMSKPYTIEDAIEIQSKQLIEWRSVLSAEAYDMLCSFVKEHNDKAESGYEICRGTMIYEILVNHIMKK